MKYVNICNMDTQGRIVIPARIRKFLNIEDGESMEVELVDQEIRMRKCSNLAFDEKQLQAILTILYNNVKRIVFVCSSAEILGTKGTYLPTGTPIPHELATYIKTGTEAMLDLASPVYLLPHLKEPVAAVFPINHEKNLALVLLSKLPLTDTESGCARLTAATLSHVLF